MKIGIGQMLVEGGEPDRNVFRARNMVQKAALAGCDVVVLPECLDLGWTWPEARERAAEIPGSRSVLLQGEAKARGIWVVAGLTERDGDRVYNAAVVIAPSGEVFHRHRKLNELSIGADLYDRGDRLGTVDTPFGRVGVAICADLFPETVYVGHALGQMGAKYILSPCAWAVDAVGGEPYGDLWLRSYSEIASRWGCVVVGASNVGWLTGGPWKGRRCIGNSIAMGPEGLIKMGRFGETAEELIVFNA